jgi:DedD protein
LIVVAIGALALVDQLRKRPIDLAVPHEPSQGLITTPPPPSDVLAGGDQQALPAPPPPQIINNETLAIPPRALAPAPAPTPHVGGTIATAPGKLYVVQLGIFSSLANAQTLQKQLQLAGIPARLETRVQLGPFKDKKDADKALARARKMGIEAVLTSSR